MHFDRTERKFVRQHFAKAIDCYEETHSFCHSILFKL